jgi:hypothetical protein
MTTHRKRTILLYGRTNSGKTYQIGEMALWVMETLGMKTRLYTADRGGTDTIAPQIDEGIIELVEMGESDPWIFLDKATRGCVRDAKTGKWVAGDNTNIGIFAFESLRGLAECLMNSMAQKAAQNVNIGGGANISFTVQGDGETLKISGSNMAHFGVAQAQITEKVWQSQKLNAPYILWTSSVSKDEDPNASGKILGPDVIGKALTGEVPRWFNLTFRIDALPGQAGQPERHILYLGNNADINAGNAVGLGNVRLPAGAPKLERTVIEPASIVQALQMIDKAQGAAREALRERLKKKA